MEDGGKSGNGILIKMATDIGRLHGKVDEIKGSIDDIKADVASKVKTSECDANHRGLQRLIETASMADRQPARVSAGKPDDVGGIIASNWKTVAKAIGYALAAAFIAGSTFMSVTSRGRVEEVASQAKTNKHELIDEIRSTIRREVPTIPPPVIIRVSADSGPPPKPNRRRKK